MGSSRRSSHHTGNRPRGGTRGQQGWSGRPVSLRLHSTITPTLSEDPHKQNQVPPDLQVQNDCFSSSPRKGGGSWGASALPRGSPGGVSRSPNKGRADTISQDPHCSGEGSRCSSPGRVTRTNRPQLHGHSPGLCLPLRIPGRGQWGRESERRPRVTTG